MLTSCGHTVTSAKFDGAGNVILVTTQGIERLTSKDLMVLPSTQYNELMLLVDHTA